MKPADDVATTGPSPYMTVEEACAYARVCKRTLYQWMKDGRLSWKWTLTGHRRVKREDLIVERPDKPMRSPRA